MEEDIPEVIVMGPDTTYSPLFWDEEGVAIGDYDLFFIGDEEYSTSSIVGLKEWFMQTDKYDPYTDIAEFTTEGMEDFSKFFPLQALQRMLLVELVVSDFIFSL